MKKIILSLLLFFSYSIQGNQYSIAFVHIGRQLPNYLYIAIEQARLFNPAADIYLVANKVAITEENSKALENISAKVVFCENLRKSVSHKKFLQSSILDTSFREGFWRNATERFYYLEELIVQHDLKNVFHLENDNMLYVDLSSLISTFSHYKGIAAVFDNDDRCIPSFLYVAQSTALTKLVEFCAQKAKSGHNDMEIIALFKKVNKEEVIDCLPIVVPAYKNKFGLRSPSGKVVAYDAMYYKYIDEFDSIFDAAAIGQYLGGLDPIHGEKTVGFINESCIFNPSFFSYEWITDNQNRKVPFAVFEGKKFRINNLHIHSKRLISFKS